MLENCVYGMAAVCGRPLRRPHGLTGSKAALCFCPQCATCEPSPNCLACGNSIWLHGQPSVTTNEWQVEKICEAASITLNLGLVDCIPGASSWSTADPPSSRLQRCTKEPKCRARRCICSGPGRPPKFHPAQSCAPSRATSCAGPSGVRVGAPAMTTRGCTEQDFKTIGGLAVFLRTWHV